MKTKISKILIIISVAMLLLAISPIFSNSYYVLLRFVVCATAIYLVYKTKKLKRKGWMWTMVVIAILFNPLLPIHLDEVDWVFVNVIVVCLFMTSLVKIRGEREALSLNMKLIKVVLGILFFVIIISVVLYCYFLKQRYFP
ncbi:MAG: hypothetical protein ISS45_03085 [Candidatus Omnitrophica bacterium]|nr:hypothetical protein [Candidatus Omnitrophota bacterium]